MSDEGADPPVEKVLDLAEVIADAADSLAKSCERLELRLTGVMGEKSLLAAKLKAIEAELERYHRQWEKTETRLSERVVRQREEIQRLSATVALIVEVLRDFDESPEPRGTQHALDAIRRIVDGRTEVAFNGARGYPCPSCERVLSICGRHGPYTRTDENQCPACLRGEP